MPTSYKFGKEVAYSFDAAIERVQEELKKEGFGILTEIDVQTTLKEKLGEDMKPYRILGACNPPFAHQAITAEPSIGTLLPCNVIVREDDASKVQVEFMDPFAILSLTDNAKVHEIAKEVRKRLERVLGAL